MYRYKVVGPRPGQRIYVPENAEVILDHEGVGVLNDFQLRYLREMLGFKVYPAADPGTIETTMALTPEEVAVVEAMRTRLMDTRVHHEVNAAGFAGLVMPTDVTGTPASDDAVAAAQASVIAARNATIREATHSEARA